MPGKETRNKKIKRVQLDQTQVGLLLGFVSVGLVLAFGAGFITGMWYQTNEQIRPLDLRPRAHTAPPRTDDQMTFYSTLTRSDAPAATAPRSATAPHADPKGPPPPAQRHRLPSAEQKADVVPHPMPEPRFSIQVGSFRARDEAEQLHTLLANKGYQSAIQTALVPGKGILYRVRVGRFAERETAKRIARRLQSEERLAVMITEVTP